MKQKCIDRVSAAAGRRLTASDIKRLEDQLDSTMRRLAKQDRARWMALPRAQQLQEAADVAGAEIRAQAQRRADISTRQILATAETNGRLDELQTVESQIKGKAVRRVVALKRDLLNTWSYIGALRTEFRSMLFDTIEAAGDKQGAGVGRRLTMALFDTENPAMTRDMVVEIFGRADGRSGNELAQAGARAWLDTVEAARTRFNAAGGDIRSLSNYGYIPQPWSSTAIAKAGAEQFAADVLPHVDRGQYLHSDGRLMDDAELLKLLQRAQETLATEGINKTEPGQFKAAGATANRHADARVIHFKDGDGYLAVMGKYGGGSLYDAMTEHINTMARDIALIERYGPSPSAQMRLQLDMTARADGTKLEQLVAAHEARPQTYWRIISGETGTPVNERLANVGQTLRSLQVAAKLGRALWSSLADLGNTVITTGYNRLPYLQLLRDIRAVGSPEAADFLSSHGLIADTIASGLDRWSAETMSASISSKLANATLRLSLLNAWTTALRQGFRMTMARGLARMAQQPWDSLSGFDRRRLQRAGITADDWQVLQQVQPDIFRGHELLTPQAVRDSGLDGAPQLATRLFAFAQSEAEHAIIESDLQTKAVTTWGGLQSGTAGGEIARTVMQFKSFPFATISRHWRRIAEGDLNAEGAPLMANRYVYGGALMASGLILGAIGEQVLQLLGGKDPINPADHPGFWLKAALRGGALSFAGDMLLTDTSSSFGAKEALGRMALGPTFGTMADVWELTKGNIDQYLAGQDTHVEAETSRFAMSLAPMGNVWWLRPMLDHAIVDNLNENLSPGYLARVKQRAYAGFSQRYWWAPGEAEPSREPDLGQAFGR